MSTRLLRAALLFSIPAILVQSCNTSKIKEDQVVFGQLNDSIYTIDFGKHHIEINSYVSGRITSYTHEGLQLLIPQGFHEEYFGSTLWPAPQSEWNWPPPPQLDGKPYNVRISEDGIYMESGADALTGLQFGKMFEFNPTDTTFEITYTIKNLNDTPRYAAPWEVTRVKGGLSFYPLGEEPVMQQSNLKSVSEINGVVWYSYEPDSLDNSQKLFSSGAEGWMGHVTSGLLFVKKVEDIHPLKTAPGQGEVEIFASKPFPYIELENHGKYTLLEPGEFMVWRVKWYVREYPDMIEPEAGNERLIKYVRNLAGKEKIKNPL